MLARSLIERNYDTVDDEKEKEKKKKQQQDPQQFLYLKKAEENRG